MLRCSRLLCNAVISLAIDFVICAPTLACSMTQRYIVCMKVSLDAEQAAAAFLDLWQRQILLSSQNPDESAKAMASRMEMMAKSLQQQLNADDSSDD